MGKLTETERYLASYAAMYPSSPLPTITRMGSWYSVVWNDGHGRKSCRSSELSRMSLRLDEMSAGRTALQSEEGK